MWEVPGCRGIDASVISRVLSGQRLFTSRQVDVFCDILKLDKRQIQALRQALRDDWSLKIGVNAQDAESPMSLSLLEYAVSRLEQERFQIPFDRYFDLNCEVEYQLVELLGKPVSASVNEKTIDMYTKTVVNLTYCRNQVVFNWTDAVHQHLTTHADLLKRVGKSKNDASLGQLSELIFYPYHYYRREYDKANEIISSVGPDNVMDEFWKTELHHSNMVTNAELGKQVVMGEFASKASGFSQAAKVRLSLGLSKAAKRVGNFSETVCHFEQAKKHLKYISPEDRLFELRKTQVLRYQAGINSSESSKALGLEMAQKVGHLRYQKELQQPVIS